MINDQDNESEEIDFEGEQTLSIDALEDTESNEEDVYPYKNINIARDTLSAFQLFRKYKNDIIKLDPEFQREGVWNQKQRSELIESIIIGIPLPILYIKENKDGNWILIDGRQRLSTIFDFMGNRFSLSNLSILKEFNGRKFSEEIERSVSRESKHKEFLDSNIRGKIEDVNLVLHIIKEPTPERLTYDLFDRVNRGGTRLNNQEMRNAIYQGSSTKFLKALSKIDTFKLVTSNIPTTRMKDRYLVLRTISFYLWKKKMSKENGAFIEYRSDLEDFLSKSMRFLNQYSFDITALDKDNYSIDEIEEKILSIGSPYSNLLKSFDKAMQNAYYLFGDDCFRLPRDGKIRRPINMALFEVLVYFFIELENEFSTKEEQIRQAYKNLIENTKFKSSNLEDDNFVKSLTYTVDSNKAVQRRFSLVEQSIKLIKAN
ncbi:DUF262 domain-containing protein [Pedobacter endophyticus]|uniref:DUF262 domain-containing protein n=1 Tax=Pedobacter endophyticus TaxID=2789740 RepID=A0A7U3Q6I6_9SPHI|nr:DUF262 domain-containing protein [Pedobacter endophyticus]QPH38752.1 DUF262 domain-containing protein [Pedobacter endophyticus]